MGWWQWSPLAFQCLVILNLGTYELEGQNVRNFPYPVRIRWSRQPNLVPFYLYNRIFECPENIRNDGFPDVRWSSIYSTHVVYSELKSTRILRNCSGHEDTPC